MRIQLLPQRIDNAYRGHWLALWLFGLVVLVRIGQSLLVIFNGSYTVANADGIPLASYPAAAAQTIVNVYANSALARLFLMIVCVVVLVRYRSAIPAMFALLALNFIAAQAIHRFIPIAKVGTPPASIANRVLFTMMIVGLALSLWERSTPRRTLRERSWNDAPIG